MKFPAHFREQFRAQPRLALGLTVCAILGLIIIFSGSSRDESSGSKGNPQAALTVTVEPPLPMRLPLSLSANGNIEAWQEASIGANVSGLVLAEVRVNVGDSVKRGQVLAVFANQTVAADLAQMEARLAEAEATAIEAEANAERAKKVADSGALSGQQLDQYATAARTARARFEAQRAAVKAQAVRLADTRISAPDDGIISARSATVGAVPAGPELFRLIRQGRLEWRAEVPAQQLALVQPGMAVTVQPGNGTSISGKVRVVAPSIDPKTRNGMVYVDLPKNPLARAGLFAAGEFTLGHSDGLTLPQSAVIVRDGFSYVYRLGENNRVAQIKVSTGRRSDERIEVQQGLRAEDQVVTAGGGFLADGDTVRVVAASAADQAASR